MLCGRGFKPSGSGRPRYCRKCTAWADGEVAGLHRLRCRECGRDFPTPVRSVHYCSDTCRENASAHRAEARSQRRLPRARRAAGAATASTTGAASPAPPLPMCRMCGKIPAAGSQRTYCSDACRTEGRRARERRRARRRLADPEKRAVHAARMRALYARNRAATASDRAVRARCGTCGREFSADRRNAKYCSGPCRKKGRARYAAAWWRRSRGGNGAPL